MTIHVIIITEVVCVKGMTVCNYIDIINIVITHLVNSKLKKKKKTCKRFKNKIKRSELRFTLDILQHY